MYSISSKSKDQKSSLNSNYPSSSLAGKAFDPSTKKKLHIDTSSLDIPFAQDFNYQNPIRHVPSRRPSLPPLSPSPSSSTCSLSPGRLSLSPLENTPISIPHNNNDSLRSRCHLTRRTTTSPNSALSNKSWNHLKSPAASFLAGLLPSPIEAPRQEEEGDEIDDYMLNKVIGYGAFSTVRQGFCISDGRRVAIKVIQRPDEQFGLERELSIWQSIAHPNLVSIQKILETDTATYVVCDYCSEGTLLNYLTNEPQPSNDKLRKWFGELCEAVRYLHQEVKVCHKDIKPENVLLDNNGSVKLCDFGLSVYQTPTLLDHSDALEQSAGGSLPYASPEQIQSRTPLTCPKTDIWSLGVVLYVMITRRLPFDDDYEPRLQQKILLGQFEIPNNVSPDQRELLEGMLCVDPSNRYSITKVMSSAWLQGAH
ncbi:kinase-like domain-containing protein [Phycomyces nitens]|nr:kinase-like domain-containing protein [Phycomyces nitens]